MLYTRPAQRAEEGWRSHPLTTRSWHHVLGSPVSSCCDNHHGGPYTTYPGEAPLRLADGAASV